jgi:hypothetical protein
MSFSSVDNKKQYATDGIVDTFAFPYPFQQTSDLVVQLKDNTTLLVTTLVENTDYTVTTVGDAGRYTSGSVVTTSTYAAGSTISILRIVDNDQQTANYNPGGDFDEQSTEDAFDKATMQAQQIYNLAVILKKTGSVAGPLELPDLADFAGKLLQINAAGTGITAVDSASSSDARVNSLFNGAAADDIFTTFINLVNGGLIIDGTGTPEGSVVAPVGSIFLRTDGGADTSIYFKETGAGNTGWVARNVFNSITNVTLVTPTIADFTNAPHDHSDAANGGFANGVIQKVSVQDGEVATGTTAMPIDDTIPQNIEGDEYMTLAITPKDASNVLEIEVVFVFATAGGQNTGVALFQDTTADALAAVPSISIANEPTTISFKHRMTAGTTSLTTFKVRAGNATGGGPGTTTFNGLAAGRIFGGVMVSSIKITSTSCNAKTLYQYQAHNCYALPSPPWLLCQLDRHGSSSQGGHKQ